MKSPSLHPQTGRYFGIDWKAADEISVAHGSWRDGPGARLKNHVILRLADSKTETGQNMSMSRVRARQIAIALWEASGKRWPYAHKDRALPNRLVKETRVTLRAEIGLALAMAQLLRGATQIIDKEIEDREHGGNDEDWQGLKIWSDQAHDLLRQIGGAA